jgi:long-chain acyl-CoA synthetase
VTTYRTVPEMFLDRVAKTPDREAFQFPTASGWGRYTWREVGQKVRSIAGGLRSLGLQNEQRGGIICSTRVEWILVDIGIMSAGGATTTIYPSNTPEECAYILKDSSTQFLFAENDEQAAKIAKVKAEVGELKKIIVIEGKGGLDGWAITLDELMKAGDAWNTANPGQYEENAQSLRGDSLATLIYTSGTTGQPKGVELTHDCWVYEGRHRGDEAAQARGRAVPVAAARALLRQGARGRAAQDRLPHRGGRPRRQARRQPRAGEADLRGRRAAHLREGLQQGRRRREGRRRRSSTPSSSGRWRSARRPLKLRQQGKQPGGLLAIKNAIATKLVFSKLQDRFGGRLQATSCRARRPCRARWPSSSTPPTSSSSRATA